MECLPRCVGTRRKAIVDHPSREVVMNEKRSLRRVGVAVWVALGLALVGCTPSEGDPSGGGKAGGSGEPLVLRMANGYSGLAYEPAVAHFVKGVEELSGGVVRIEVVDEWGLKKDVWPPEFEQTIVRDVAAGEVDLAWVGTRIFDTLGVRSFQALTAPMLVDSYPLQRAVIESDIPLRMMEGLEEIGVTGLAILADGLRKPIAVEQPLLGPDDWRGITFAAFRSEGQAEAIRSLGARPTDVWGGPLDEGLDSGQIQGFEKSVHIYQLNDMQRTAPFVTANVNLWPQTVALIADPDRLSGLTEQQRGWLEQAATDAAGVSTDLADRDERLLAGLCEHGAAFVNASDADITALSVAFMPVYAALEQDSRTKAFIAEIEQLKKQMPSGDGLVLPDACTGAASQTETKTTKVTPLDGVWEVTYTRDDLLAAIERNPGGDDHEDNPANYGHLMIEFDRGDYTGTGGDGSISTCTYAVEGDAITFFCEDFTITNTWSVYRDTLTIGVGKDAPNTPWMVKPWRRVSD